MSKVAPDSKLIHNNRIFLDNYYLTSCPNDHISVWIKGWRILKCFGITGLIKKIQKQAGRSCYASDNYEEQCEEVVLTGKKIAVYTAIIGKYDNLIEPKYVSPNCDYFIFTDMDVVEDSIWVKKPLPSDDFYKKLGNYQKAKYFKIFPHKLFPEYDYSIWVDGNISIYGDLAPFVQRMDGKFIAEFKHPNNNCIYEEAYSIVSQGKARGKDVRKQIQSYRIEGFPENYGLLENSFIVRQHNNLKCIELMETWWKEMLRHSWRDQLSLSYSLWKTGQTFDAVKILGPCWRWNPRLRQHDHV